MEKVNLYGIIKINMTVIFMKTIFREKENINGQMDESSMANGSMIRWKALGRLLGLTGGNILGNTEMV